MRFVLNDENKADIKGIESMSVVKGTFTQAGQFQVIIGNQVSDFYKDFILKVFLKLKLNRLLNKIRILLKEQ
jgi:glucose-like phosphotransferase system IIB component